MPPHGSKSNAPLSRPWRWTETMSEQKPSNARDAERARETAATFGRVRRAGEGQREEADALKMAVPSISCSERGV